MNIDTLLEAAKYVDSVGAQGSTEHQLTRGKDETDSNNRHETRPFPSSVPGNKTPTSPPIRHHHVQSPPPPRRACISSPVVSSHHPAVTSTNVQHHSPIPPQHHRQTVAVATPPLLPTPLAPPPPAPSAQPVPEQAVNLLQFAERPAEKLVSLTSIPQGGAGSGNHRGDHRGDKSPRIVHQIVGHHSQWMTEMPKTTMPSSPSSGRLSGNEMDDSPNDGSGKDKRAGIREVHNKLEKNRRAHLKECFENLRAVLPNMEDKKSKTSNLSILRGALRYSQVLIRKERELEHEIDRLVRQKIQNQQRLDQLKIKNGISPSEPVKLPTDADEEEDDNDSVIVERDLVVVVDDKKKVEEDDDQASTSTASEAEEEERKSQEQSRSQSPLQQPVMSHLPYPSSYHHLPSSTTHQALSHLHSPTKHPSHPAYANPAAPHLPGLSQSANEAMMRMNSAHHQTTSPQKSEPGADSSRLSRSAGDLRMHYGSMSAGNHGIPPSRNMYVHMNQDKVSSVLQNVASQIAPAGVAKRDTPGLGTQPVSAMAGSVARQTVSQLLGKQPVIRQPVRRQMPVIQSPLRQSSLLPRIVGTPPVRFSLNQVSQNLIGPSKPVVTVGINSLLAQPSVIQTPATHKTVITNGMVSSAVGLNTAGLAAKQTSSVLTSPTLTTPSTSIPVTVAGTVSQGLMTASVITQTVPVMSHAGHNPFISPIALHSSGAPGSSLFLTQPTGYISLPPTVITQPFVGPFPITQPSHIQAAASTQVSPSSSAPKPAIYPSATPVATLGTSAISLALAQAALPKHLSHATTVSFSSAFHIANPAVPVPISSTVPASANRKTLPAVSPIIAPPPTCNASPTKVKSTSSSIPVSPGSNGSRAVLGRAKGGKSDNHITTSQIAETMASMAGSAQTLAKTNRSGATVTSRTTQSVVVKP